MIEDMKKTELCLRKNYEQFENVSESLSLKQEELKKEQNKRLSQIYREMEKFTIAVERKVNIDDLNERMDSKADKHAVNNALQLKANKQEIE